MIRRLVSYIAFCTLLALAGCSAESDQRRNEGPGPSGSVEAIPIDPCSLVDSVLRISFPLGTGLPKPDVPVAGARSCHWFSTDREYSLVFGFFPAGYSIDEISLRYADATFADVDGRRAVQASSGLDSLGPTCLLFTELQAGRVAYTQVRLLDTPAGIASKGPCLRIVDFTRAVLTSANL
ncbi:DUF3558 family protein [Pseudonocardia sulfidoxydans]|uniref:DUF3558 family protein n=1 Tax=Pseudonocardia sulfidoxydans TaxID=54011 RepID=UPI0011BFDB95